MATTRFIDHLLEGDHASRPAFGDVPEGTLYSCTTHSLIYQSDGSTAWSTWATLGGGSPDAADVVFDPSGLDNTAATDVQAAMEDYDAAITAASGGGFTPVGTRYLDNSSHADYTTTSTSFVALDASSDLTVTTGAHRVLIGVVLSASNSGGASTAFDIDIDGTKQGNTSLGLIFTNAAASNPAGLAFTYMSAALTAASHTFKLYWKVSANTGKVYVNTTGVAFEFWVAELGF